MTHTTHLMEHPLFKIALAILSGMLLTFCSEDEELPCANLPAIGIETLSAVKDSLFKEDTFLVSASSEANVIFSMVANGRNFDSLAWRIGNDPRTFTEPTVSLRFDRQDVGEVNVELTVWRARDDCFPEDSVMNVSKRIHILSQESISYAFEGTFAGYNESDPDRIFEVTVVNFGPFPPPNDSARYWLHVYNLIEGCGNEEISIYDRIPEIEQASYQHFYVNGTANTTTNCPEIKGYGRVDSTGTLTIDYLYLILGTAEERQDRFIGIKKPS